MKLIPALLIVGMLAVSGWAEDTKPEPYSPELVKRAEAGEAKAQYNFGMCYAKGEGVPQDHSLAVFWYRKAAEKGHAEAQINLGINYENGVGVAKDEIEAYAFLNLAGMTDEAARKRLSVLEKKISQDARLLGQKRTKELQKEIEARQTGK